MTLPGVEVLAAVGAAGGGVTALVLAGRWLRRLYKRADTFLGDWEGVAARPGVPARAGVMQRLAVIEGEVRHNGGGSLKDAVARTETAVRELGERLDGHIAASREGHR